MGVHLGNGNLEEENWRPRINAVEKCLNCWRGRSLSSSGKALIVNALALSRVWYVASLLPVPDWVVSELNTLVFSFFWSGKRDLVARDVVYHSTFQGFGVVFVRYYRPCAPGSVGSSLCYCPECVGPYDDLLAFRLYWGRPPNCPRYPISFPLSSFGPSSFLLHTFACLDCASRLLVLGWPDRWFSC